MNDKDRDVVVSTRVRLARSVDGMLFTPKMQAEDYPELNEKVLAVLNKNKDYEVRYMSEQTPIQKRSLIESHLVSNALVENQNAMLLINDKNNIYIMVGEEDHIRLQCILKGLQLEQADELTSSVDKILSNVIYAFDDSLGHLTACPTNLGTGMRASVMLHLPAALYSGQMKNIVEGASKFGYTFRGYYGEGTNALGHMFQLSNQVTLGISEEEIISGISHITRTIINSELEQRDKMLRKERTRLSDRLYRSLGTLKYARIISESEMMGLMSDLRLGLSIGLFEGITNNDIESLIFDLQPATLFMTMQSDENIGIDMKRADIIRNKLASCHEK